MHIRMLVNSVIRSIFIAVIEDLKYIVQKHAELLDQGEFVWVIPHTNSSITITFKDETKETYLVTMSPNIDGIRDFAFTYDPYSYRSGQYFCESMRELIAPQDPFFVYEAVKNIYNLDDTPLDFVLVEGTKTFQLNCDAISRTPFTFQPPYQGPITMGTEFLEMREDFKYLVGFTTGIYLSRWIEHCLINMTVGDKEVFVNFKIDRGHVLKITMVYEDTGHYLKMIDPSTGNLYVFRIPNDHKFRRSFVMKCCETLSYGLNIDDRHLQSTKIINNIHKLFGLGAFDGGRVYMKESGHLGFKFDKDVFPFAKERIVL